MHRGLLKALGDVASDEKQGGVEEWVVVMPKNVLAALQKRANASVCGSVDVDILDSVCFTVSCGASKKAQREKQVPI